MRCFFREGSCRHHGKQTEAEGVAIVKQIIRSKAARIEPGQPEWKQAQDILALIDWPFISLEDLCELHMEGIVPLVARVNHRVRVDTRYQALLAWVRS